MRLRILRNTCGLEDQNDGLEIHHGCVPTINNLVFNLDYENPEGWEGEGRGAWGNCGASRGLTSGGPL